MKFKTAVCDMLKIMLIVCLLIPCACAGKHVQRENILIKPQLPVSTVYFSTASDRLQRKYIRSVEKNSEWMKNNAESVVILEGHCDERDSAKNNLYLGDRRARAVAEALFAQGIDKNRIVVISYGEREPVDDRHGEFAWKKNRRVEFVER